MNNPQDETALLRVINTPPRGIGKTTIDRLAGHATRHGLPLLGAARQVGRITAINARSAKQVTAFVAIVDRLAAVAEGQIEELLGHVLSETAYEDQWRASANPEDEERLANIEELLTVAREFDERREGTGHLEAFLEETALVNDTDDWETALDRVTLMTLHASKGLEFPVVYIVAVEEGLLPHQRSQSAPDQVEEERRLFFVGITRAQQELQISMAQYRDFRGLRKLTVPSSFLMELPLGEMAVETRPGGEPVPAPGGFEPMAEPVYEEPVFRSQRPAAAVGAMPAMGLQTAAELANGGRPSPPPSPDVFQHGMLVLHPEYGLGRIVALSGSGPGRKATVDFSSSAGRKKFILSASPLRPVKA